MAQLPAAGTGLFMAHAAGELTAWRTVRDNIVRSALLSLALFAAWQTDSWAKPNDPSAISGLTNRDGGDGCVPCHGSSGGNITVTLTGDSTLTRGQSATYTVTGSLGANTSGKKMGTAIAAQDTGNTISGSAPLQYLSGSRELIHNSDLGSLPATNGSGVGTYTFTYTMPSNAAFGSTHKLYAVARIHNGATAANEWAHADDKTVTTITPAPTINSSSTKTGKVGVSLSYQIGVTSGSTIQAPTSYGASNRPAGISVNTSTGLLSGTPTDATNGTPVVTSLSATNSGGTDNQNLSFTISKGDQTLSFPSQSAQTFSPGGTFNVSTATTSPAAAPSPLYVSTTPAKCTRSSSTSTLITIVEAGPCTIVASQPGNTDWSAAPVLGTHTRTFNINKASQTITFPSQASRMFVDGGTFTISPAASSTSGLAVTYTSLTPAVCTKSASTSTTVTMLDTGTCQIEASRTSDTNYLAATPVVRDIQINELPGQPVIGTRYPGNGRAIIAFTPPANPGSILFYTATCTGLGETTRTGTNTVSPILVTGLTNTVTYSCSITATNSTGTGPMSAFGAVTPSTAAVVPTIRSAGNTTMRIGETKSFKVLASGTPSPTITRGGVALPTGVTFSTNIFAPGVGTLAGTPAEGSVGGHSINFTATNASGDDTNAFSLLVVKGSPVITFAPLADRPYSPTPFAISATVATLNGAPSTPAIVFSSLTGGICSVTGSNVTMFNIGTCTIAANRLVDSNYNAAAQVTQSFDIDQASQTITFGAASPSSRTYSPGLTYTLNPVATASSGLPVSYNSGTPSICSIAGTTVSVLGGGTCIIEASRDGNALYLPATDAMQNTIINQASQSITFPVQAAQPFVEGGSFAISPLATASSGLVPAYASTTPAVCTVFGTTVTIVSTGNCFIEASQAGDASYLAATPTVRIVAINAVPPGAPVLDVAIASDATVRLAFIPSASTGGAAVSGFRGTCNPGNNFETSAQSPVVVSGLTNGVSYTCSVVAQNAAGDSAPSNSIAAVVPFLDTGANLWANNDRCSSCHGLPPTGTRFNAAGDTAAVLQYVRTNVDEMLSEPSVQALTANELAEIAKYIKQQLPAIAVDTPYQTAVQIDVAFPNHITLNSQARTFGAVEAVTPPTNGVLSAFSGTTVIYTPNPGFAGTDTFTYRGFRTGPTVQGEPRTVTVNVLVPGAAPVITSAGTANGVFGQLFQYQITATNGPASYSASSLPPDVGVNTATGLISGTPTAAGVFNATIGATNPNPASPGTAGLVITISAAAQSITFGAQGAQAFGLGGTFAISPLATATSNLAVTFSSLTTGVCTVSGTTVTKVAAGTCTIAANQPGNTNYNAALQVTQDVAINASVPGAPVIGIATPGNLQVTIAFTAPGNNGGSAITGYNASCTPSGTGSNSVSPIVISALTNGVQYTCSVTATNSAGTSGASSTVMVTPQNTPVAPAFTSAVSTTFTVLTSNTFNVTASGEPPPSIALQTGSLPTGVTFNSGVLAGTPATGTVGAYPVTFRATGTAPFADQSFTLTVVKANQTISFTNPGARNFSSTPFAISPAPTASSGLAVVLTSNTTSVCTVSGINVTMIATGVCSISANVAATTDYNAANTITHGFSIGQASQSITFGAQTSPRTYSLNGTFPVSPAPTASSGLAVTVNSNTPSICSVSGNVTVLMLAAGTCTLVATQTGNANYSLATPVPQNITINAVAPGAPSIGVATGSDMQVSIGFTPPASSGGSAITQYNATCSPSGTGSGSSSPVVVTGLTNGVAYTCSVTATNASGFTGPASGTVMVTPTSANGSALWGSICFNCHGPTPAGNQLNGAGNTATVLNHVRVNQPLMLLIPAVQNLSQAELAALAAYIGNVVPANEITTAFNTAKAVNVSAHITLTNHLTSPSDNWSAFSSVEVVTPPANGMVSAFTGTTATYTPNPGFSGTDTFTYRGKRTGPDVTGDPRSVTVNVLAAAPGITSPGSANGTFGLAFNYQIAASGSPGSFGASGLPSGVTVDTLTGAISGTPSATGVFNATVSATNASGTGNAPLVITIAKAAQAIAFNAQTPSSRPFASGSTFSVNPLATGGLSGNSIVYSSTTGAVCTVNGTTVSMVTAGTCTIAANQAGDDNYLAAPQVTQNVSITATVPGAPAVSGATPGNAQAQIAFTAPSQNGGSMILDYTATCTASGQTTRMGTGTTSPVLVASLVNGVTYSCSVTARNSAGNSAASGGVDVTPTLVTPPGAPVIGLATAGDGSAAIGFSPPGNNGGAAITQYTATCAPGGVPGSNASSPVTVNSLTNGVTYSCTVTATNSAGPGPASAAVDVTPEATIALVSVASVKTHGGGAGERGLPIPNPLEPIAGPVTVEPRSIVDGHRIVFTFDKTVIGVTSVLAMNALSQQVGSASPSFVGNKLTVTLTGIADNTRVKVTVTGVNGVFDTYATIGFLVGDVTGSRSVNAADISAVKARQSSLVNTDAIALFDLDLSGAINNADVTAAKARSGLVLP